MRTLKFLLISILFFVLLLPSSPLSAEVRTDVSVFQVVDFTAEIGNQIYSLAEFESRLKKPMLAGTTVRISFILERQIRIVPYLYFLRLSSNLDGVRWDVQPPELKREPVWRSHGTETFLWVPPQHDIAQLRITVQGSVTHPIIEESQLTAEGARVKRDLLRRLVHSPITVEVRKSTADFPYAADPESWVRASLPELPVLQIEATASSKTIEVAAQQVREVEEILADLEVPDGLPNGRYRVGERLEGLLASAAALVELSSSLLQRGYPSIALEISQEAAALVEDAHSLIENIAPVAEYEREIATLEGKVGELQDEISRSKDALALLKAQVETERREGAAARTMRTVFLLLFIAALIGILATAILGWRSKKKVAEEAIDFLESRRGEVVDDGLIEGLRDRI